MGGAYSSRLNFEESHMLFFREFNVCECGEIFAVVCPVSEILKKPHELAMFFSLWQLEYRMHKINCVSDRVMKEVTSE